MNVQQIIEELNAKIKETLIEDADEPRGVKQGVFDALQPLIKKIAELEAEIERIKYPLN